MSRPLALLAIAAILTGMIPATPSVAGTGGATRAGMISHSTVADFGSGLFDGVEVSAREDGELSLSRDQTQGQFSSPILKTSFEFNAVGVNWTESRPEDAQLEIELRTSRDGKEWKDWHPIGDGDIPSRFDQHSSDLFLVAGSYVQYRVSLVANEQGQTPALEDIVVKYIDSRSGPDFAAVRAARSSLLQATPSGQPFIISRAMWNTQEPYSSVNWPPEYEETRTTVVHHTDTPMNTDPLAAVRAIWYDHTFLKGWGDIGYNYLVDTSGNIYEGRFGGDNVAGGHAGYPYNYGSLGVALIGTYLSVPPTGQSLSSLTDLLAWKFNWHQINPTGSGWFHDRYVNNIMGHLDVGPTECPGGELYYRLSGVRNLAKSRESWWSHNTLQRMLAGQSVWVSVEVQNRGTQTWYPGGNYSFDLGYRWYFLSGTQYLQPPQDDHRAQVPWPVGYDQRVTINILLTAPTLPGTYRLEWDMVQENVAWFKDYGNTPLVVTVEVEQPTPTPIPTNTPVPTATPTFTPTPVPPTLQLDHSSVGFLTTLGVTPGAQAVRVLNAGTGTFSWQAVPSSSGSWLRVEPSSGSQGGEFAVSVNRAALSPNLAPPALLEGSITVQTSSGVVGSPRSIPVRLVIADRLYLSHFPRAYKAFSGGW